MRLPYCSYDEATGHYAYYAGEGKPRLQLPPTRGRFMDYRDVDVLMPEDVQPVGSGLTPKGIVVQPNQVFCMPPCNSSTTNQGAWLAFMWGLRFLFL